MSNYGSIKFFKELDYDATKEKIEKRIEECYFNYELVKKILEVLKDCEGCIIGKVLQNKLNKAIPDHDLRVTHKYGMYYIQDWDQPKEYNIYDQLIGYDSQGNKLQSIAKLKYWACCYTLELDRAIAKKKGLEILEARVIEWNGNIERLKGINKEMEAFELEYTFDLTNEAMQR